MSCCPKQRPCVCRPAARADRTFSTPRACPDTSTRSIGRPGALCGSQHDAEDLVQETLVNVLKRPRLLRDGNELGYLLRALRNTFSTRYRLQAQRPVVHRLCEHDAVAMPDQEHSAREIIEAIAERPAAVSRRGHCGGPDGSFLPRGFAGAAYPRGDGYNAVTSWPSARRASAARGDRQFRVTRPRRPARPSGHASLDGCAVGLGMARTTGRTNRRSDRCVSGRLLVAVDDQCPCSDRRGRTRILSPTWYVIPGSLHRRPDAGVRVRGCAHVQIADHPDDGQANG